MELVAPLSVKFSSFSPSDYSLDQNVEKCLKQVTFGSNYEIFAQANTLFVDLVKFYYLEEVKNWRNVYGARKKIRSEIKQLFVIH